ncbi:MAG TPA: hypothetical protein VNB90_15125 [Cytophagaceae bacterium]|jgi:hypothetical protein|nr:hypothetical protein [Cytophagaceae bacterium]
MSENKKELRIPLKNYTMKELLIIYGVSRNTFKKWLKPLKKLLGNRDGYYYSILQIKIIFSALQLPSHVVVIDESEYGLYDKMQPRLDK